jgi:acetylornithine deacetylase/succinyl-diaminopimelate desuccinylase family protein
MIQRASTLLGELVACPSVNPLRPAPFGPPCGEARIAALLADKLRALGAEVQLEEVFPDRPNTIAHFPGRNRDVTLLLEAHADTVAVEGMNIPPFDPVVRDGRLYGRGTCDTNASLAAMVLAMEDVIRSDGAPPTDVFLVSTCDEEHGAGGAQGLVETGRRFDAAIVGEPTELTPVCVSKGAIRFRIKTHGKAAHSSCPEEGVNAIYAMRRVLEAIEDQLLPSLAKRPHPVVGAPKATVGTIEGGSQVNIVPSDCLIMLDRRLVPGESREQAEAEVRAVLDRLRFNDSPLQYDCESTQYYPAFEQDAKSPVVQCALAACQSVLGRGEEGSAPWASNAGFFAQAGTPCVVLGPGSIEQAHKQVEFVELAQVADAVEVYAQIVRSFDEFATGAGQGS